MNDYSTGVYELFKEYCTLLKKKDFKGAETLFQKIKWRLFINADYLFVLKSVPVITEELLFEFLLWNGKFGLWGFYIDNFILKSRIRRKMSPKVEAYGWKYVYQIAHLPLEDRFILILALNKITLSDKMTNEELNYFNQLPTEFTVYRGTNEQEFDKGELDKEELGISWTPEQKVAEYFAFRREEHDSLISKRIVLAATVRKEDVTACLLDRNETELIISPSKLYDIHVLLTQKTNLYDIYAAEVNPHIKKSE